MSRSITHINVASDTFGSWLTKTNDIIDVISETVTVKANTAGDLTTGNGFVIGTFGANTIKTSIIKAGNVTTDGSLLIIGSNTNIGNSTVSVYSKQNNVAETFAMTSNTTNTDLQTVDSFTAATYRGGKYVISMTDTANSAYQVTEILLMHDGSAVQTTEYATLTSVATLGVFEADISGGSVRLRVTPTYANNTIKLQRTLL